PVRLGQPHNFVCAFCSFENKRTVFFRKVAERCEDLVEQLIDCLPARLCIRRYFAKHDYRAVAILIANKIGATVTVALSTAENVKRRVCETNPSRLLFVEIDITLSQLFWDCV